MLPCLVRRCICLSCRLNHGAWNGGSTAFQRLPVQRVRPLSSGSIRHLPRSRAIDTPRKTASGGGGRLGTANVNPASSITLSPKQKDALAIFGRFKAVMRGAATKAAVAGSNTTEDITAASITTEDMTADQVIGLTTVKRSAKGYRSIVSKLKSVYGVRLYEEMDRDLEAIMAFRRGNRPLSHETEKILMALGFFSEPVLRDSTALEQQVTSTVAKTPDVPVPVQGSIALDTQNSLLEFTAQSLLGAGGERVSPPPLTPAPKIRGLAARWAESQSVKKGERIAIMKGDLVQVASAERYPLTPISMETSEVPRLCHDLSRVLFNPGVYQLQDPRSRVWNFDPYLGNLMPVSEFNYDALNQYITSSEDVQLRNVALQRELRYVGSTSSMSGVLVHFHFLLSGFRELKLSNLSRGFEDEGHGNFTKIQRGPSAIFLRHQDGVYAVDADKEYDSANILMSLGRSMEKLLTSDREEFERYRRTEDATRDAEVKSSRPEAYHYSGLGQFLLRSQLDAYDPRLPGTGMFDLKTRAVAAVRMMVRAHEKGVGYQIKDRFGTWESYEREYFDMMRSAFLKYSLQVRMGRMDGIFVAFHNTERLFGFQYVPLTEMDIALHGQSDRTLGDQEFSLSIQMLNHIFNEATKQYPGQSLRFHFEAREATDARPQSMLVFAEPVTEDEIVAIQTLRKDEIRAAEERLLNPDRTKSSEGHQEDTDSCDLESGIEDAESANGSTASLLQQNSKPTLHQSNAANVDFLDSILGMDLKQAMAPESKDAAGDGSEAKSRTNESLLNSAPEKPLSAWKLHVRNIVNGMAVVRPENLRGGDTWSLQYTLKPLSEAEGRRHYNLCKNRRKTTLSAPQDTDEAANFYLNNLIKMSRRGAQWRQRQDKLDAEKAQVVLYGD